MADYYFARTVDGDLDAVVGRVTEALKAEGFGVLTTIDVQATLKNKLDVDFRPYRILGACNPQFAHRALLAEDKIGTMLPCNVVVQDAGGGRTEVAAVDPIASMASVENPALADIAGDVRERLRRVVRAI
jgi:uncharacterized protein (DUF302 family)